MKAQVKRRLALLLERVSLQYFSIKVLQSFGIIILYKKRDTSEYLDKS